MTDYSRQSFLGKHSTEILCDTTIGLIGYGGGGSHLGQQFAHIGIGHIIIIDDDTIEDSNLNRLVGGTPQDVAASTYKVSIAERAIKSINPNAVVDALNVRWQNAADQLATCDIILGAVDSYRERDGLERFARRNLIPYIDIGMDVINSDDGTYQIIGQIIQSIPGAPCMRCCNFITDDKMKEEAKRYGDAGPRPQVIWPNGVLASTAVGLTVALLCPWHKHAPPFRYLAYDGNTGALTVPCLTKYLADKSCPHHPITELGDPLCDIRKYNPLHVPTNFGTDEKTQARFLFKRIWDWLRW